MNDSLPVPKRIVLTADVGLDRASYEALAEAMLAHLADETRTLASRLLAMHALVGAAVAEYGRGTRTASPFSVWLDTMGSRAGRAWLQREVASSGPGRPGRQRLAVGPFVSLVESRGGRGQLLAQASPTRMAIPVARGLGTIRSTILSTVLHLPELSRIRLAQDSTELGPSIAEMTAEWLRSGALFAHPSLIRGTQYLLLFVALVRWYAAGAALAGGREEVAAGDLAQALAIVEGEFVRGDLLSQIRAQRPRTATMLDLLLDLAVRPADLAMNPYTGRTSG